VQAQSVEQPEGVISLSTVKESIDVQVPVSTAYNQWTQFEEFPQFMEGVEKVVQLDDTRLRWAAEVGGKHREWEAKIVKQEPDRRVAWTSVEGAPNAGAVTFEPAGPESTRIYLELDYQPEGIVEKAGDVLGATKGRVKGDLERFKSFIESRGTETGEWRGEIRQGQER
jgi:uncharacterized membrane protein